MLLNVNMDIIKTLTISELDTLRFIDKNKKDILPMSIQDLSKLIFVSTATIMRLCKKIGFSGFTELKYKLREEIKIENSIKKATTIDDILNQNIKSITETAKMLDKEKIEQVAALMNEPVRIHFFGKGLTATILDYASKLLLTNHRANFNYQDTHIAYLAAEAMNSQDLLFACSLNGYTHQVIRMAEIAKYKGAKVVVISQDNNNLLSKIGDYNFVFYNGDTEKTQVDISSRLPMLFILNIIINSYIQKK